MNNPVETAKKTPQSGVDWQDNAAIERALRTAVYAALRDHKESGDYVVAWQDGKVVYIAPEDIVVPDEDSKE